MAIVLTCGFPYSEIDKVYGILTSVGVRQAQPWKEDKTPWDLTRALLHSANFEMSACETIRQCRPGRVWDSLAANLVLANLHVENWGWADHDLIYLLEYWRELEPDVRLCLVYSSPQFAVSQLVHQEHPCAHKVAQTLAYWESYNRELLRFVTRDNGSTVFVNVEAVSADPASFVARCGSTLNVPHSEHLCDYTLPNMPPNAIANLVAANLLNGSGAVRAEKLYQELEAIADLPLEHRSDHAVMASAAWSASRDMSTQLNETLEKCSLINGERDSLRQETEFLQMQLHQVKKELEDTSLRAVTAEEALRSREADNDEFEINSQAQERCANAAQIEAQEVRAQSSEAERLSTENELLLLQLHQVQEELKTYFVEYNDLKKHLDKADQTFADTKRAQSSKSAIPVRHVIDMRGMIDGESWHEPESHGRWAGPGNSSTLRLPVLPEGQYWLEIEVVGAMTREILTNLTVSIGGKPVKTSRKEIGVHTGPLAPMKRIYAARWLKQPVCPILLRGLLVIDSSMADVAQTLELRFPKTVSPADQGSSDARDLTLCMRELRIAS